MNRITLFAGITLALAIPAFAVAPTRDIVDSAAGASNLSTLVSLVKAAELVETLKSEGPFTVFAPTNTAFSKVPKATLNKVGGDKALLTSVLTYHVVPGKVMAADVLKLDGKHIKTVQGQNLRVKISNGKVFINNAQVVLADINCTNGVVHQINAVLLPKTK